MFLAVRVNKQLIIYSLALTLVFELVTVLLRFGLNLRSSEATASTVGKLTFGLRIHHGYIGVVMVVLSLLFSRTNKPFRQILLITGIALVLSDAVHHFVVLWLITGSPEFDVFYPAAT